MRTLNKYFPNATFVAAFSGNEPSLGPKQKLMKAIYIYIPESNAELSREFHTRQHFPTVVLLTSRKIIGRTKRRNAHWNACSSERHICRTRAYPEPGRRRSSLAPGRSRTPDRTYGSIYDHYVCVPLFRGAVFILTSQMQSSKPRARCIARM